MINMFYDDKKEVIGAIAIIRMLQMRIFMVTCFQSFKVITLSLKKIFSRSDVEMLIFRVYNGIDARTTRNSPVLKIRPPVLLILRRYKNNVGNMLNWLISQSVKIECILGIVLRYTIHAVETNPFNRQAPDAQCYSTGTALRGHIMFNYLKYNISMH